MRNVSTKANLKIHKPESEKTKKDVSNNLERIQDQIEEFNLALRQDKSQSTQTRKRLTTVGRERRAFTQKSLLVAIQHSELLPPSYQAEELEQWLDDEQTLLKILQGVEILKRHIYDRYYELTHQEFQVALKVYRRSRIAAMEDQPEMPAIYEVLSKMYRKSNASKEKPNDY